MRLLLDTHTLLWFGRGDPQLSGTARSLMADPAHELYLSTASAWELAIKVGLGKLSLGGPYPDFVARAIRGLNLNVLPVTLEDCETYVTLPFPDPQHRDPFDRMILTHGLRHSLSVVGVDVRFDAYGVTRLW